MSKGQSIARTKARRTVVDGIEFSSQAEADRYSELRMLERGARIVDLHLQPRFTVFDAGGVKIEYVADFAYREGVRIIVEDVKGMKTADYLLKRKMFVASHPNHELYEVARGKVSRVIVKNGRCLTAKAVDWASLTRHEPLIEAAKRGRPAT